MAAVMVKTTAELRKGFTCDVCKKPVPPTTLNAVTCPHCKQRYISQEIA